MRLATPTYLNVRGPLEILNFHPQIAFHTQSLRGMETFRFDTPRFVESWNFGSLWPAHWNALNICSLVLPRKWTTAKRSQKRTAKHTGLTCGRPWLPGSLECSGINMYMLKKSCIKSCKITLAHSPRKHVAFTDFPQSPQTVGTSGLRHAHL